MSDYDDIVTTPDQDLRFLVMDEMMSVPGFWRLVFREAHTANRTPDAVFTSIAEGLFDWIRNGRP